MAIALAAATLAACGKKGAPLPPMSRVPSQVGELTAARIDTDVFVRFTVPTANVDGQRPADIARVEVYAITANREPTAEDDAEDIRERATLVATENVRRPVPPPPPPKPGEPEPPPLPVPPGVDQGAVVVVREQLTPEMRKPIELPARDATVRSEDVEPLPGPLVAPIELNEPKRYYFVVPVSLRGRYGSALPYVPVPLGPTTSAPSAPTLSYEEKTLTLKWSPPKDVRGSQSPSEPDVIPSKPIGPQVEPTFYDVYEVSASASARADPARATADRSARADPARATADRSARTDPARATADKSAAPVTLPTPLTQAPIGDTQLTQPISALGVERCFMVRSVDVVSGYHVRGPASPVACIELTDKFPPAPPASLAAVASGGAINLIWDPSPSSDLAGYLVLRAEAPGATLTPLTKDPLDRTAFVDKTVKAGVTYTYAVVAVDKSGNRSTESDRVEETARQ
jgi:hypothetical protein